MCLQAASLRTMFRQSALILMLLCHINDIRLLLPLVDNGAKLLYLCKDPFLQLVHKTFLLLLFLQRSDYINASFMDGYRQKNAYIGTQGMSHTVHTVFEPTDITQKLIL